MSATQPFTTLSATACEALRPPLPGRANGALGASGTGLAALLLAAASGAARPRSSAALCRTAAPRAAAWIRRAAAAHRVARRARSTRRQAAAMQPARRSWTYTRQQPCSVCCAEVITVQACAVDLVPDIVYGRR